VGGGGELGAVDAGGELEPVDELVDAAGSPVVSEPVACAPLDMLYAAGSELEVASDVEVAGDRATTVVGSRLASGV
jgi:hypothetical protein